MRSRVKAPIVTWVTKGSVRIELERRLGIIDGDIFEQAYNDTHMTEDIYEYFERLVIAVNELKKVRQIWIV